MGQQRKSIFGCKAFAELRDLAEAPFDLTASGALTPRRIQDYVCRGSEFDLLYGCQRLTPQVLDCLQSLVDEVEVVAQFEEMRSGAVLNKIAGYPSEERQVLHTACRDIFSDAPSHVAAADRAKEDLEGLKDFLDELESGSLCNAAGQSFSDLVHIGIGGSDLGPRAVYEALRPYKKGGREVRFISNVDPDDCAAVLEGLDLSRTLVLVVSKSGTTLETLANEGLVRGALQEAGLDPRLHCLAITGQGSPMDDPDRYRRSFYMYDYIGGRFSATSMVGAVMLGFALGYDQVLEFLGGAASMDTAATAPDIRDNVPLLLAMLGIWNHTFLGMGSVAVLPYSQGLHRFPVHLQQCDMESNGKGVQRDAQPLAIKSGPIVWGEPGTNGQHAFYQLLHQGTEEVAVEFIGFRESQRNRDRSLHGSNSQEKLVSNLLAQSLALAIGKADENPNKSFPGNRVNLILMGQRLTPRVMGALLALYEAKIVFQGFCWNVNSFDQEGVQLGKVLARKILAALAGNDGTALLEDAILKVAGMKVGRGQNKD